MNVGILGSGDVAQALGTGFLKHGHGVMLGTRDPAKLSDWVRGSKGGRAGSFAEAAAFGEVLLLAVKGNIAAEPLKAAGDHLKGKVVVDACNPIADAPPTNGVLQFFTGPNDSLMERLQKQFPTAKFVKAFSCVGAPLMVDPQFKGGKPTMFICGDDAAAKKAVTGILDQFGWETADMGGVMSARAIEPLCILWCLPGFMHNQWTHAFKLLK